MEVISYCSASCPSCIADSGRKSLSARARQTKLSTGRRRSRFFFVNLVSLHGSARFSVAARFGSKELGVNRSNPLKVVRNSAKSDPRAFGKSYNGHVVGGGEEDSVLMKVLIPGLPDKSRGDREASIHSCFWEWKPNFTVHYEKAGCENLESPQMLFLPGFGVGSFHYEKQLKDLGRGYRVWALDFLGQGKSLPLEDPAPQTQ